MNWEDETPPSRGGGVLRKVENFTGLRVTVVEGDGDKTIMREVVHYFDERAERIAVVDNFPGGRVP